MTLLPAWARCLLLLKHSKVLCGCLAVANIDIFLLACSSVLPGDDCLWEAAVLQSPGLTTCI